MIHVRSKTATGEARRAPPLQATAGASYELIVEPRGASVLPGALLGPIGGAIDAASNENAGAFQLRVGGA